MSEEIAGQGESEGFLLRCREVLKSALLAGAARCKPFQREQLTREVSGLEGDFEEDFISSFREAPSIEIREIRYSIRLAALVAGVFSIVAPDTKHAHAQTWLHLNTFLLDALDECPADLATMELLAAVEVARGEVCEVYRLVRGELDESLPEECAIFFEALDQCALALARRLDTSPASRHGMEVRSTRSKYSGALERYPISIRTCVQNDVQRYFPGTHISVSDRVINAVRGTFWENIDQLCPEDSGLLSSLLLNVPSLAFALRTSAFQPEQFVDNRFSVVPSDSPSWGYAWTVSLDRMFFGDNGLPTEVGRRVVQTGQFGPFELLDGILNSMARPWGHSNQMEFHKRLRIAMAADADRSIDALVSEIQERSRISQTIDPSFARQQFGIYIDDHDAVRIAQFAAWSVSGLTDSNQESQEHRLTRGNITQSIGGLMRERIEEFEWLIGQELPEAKFQHFLERNPFLLAALGPYARVVPHVVLHEDNGSALIPDFFLEFADRRETDIVELKLPVTEVDVSIPPRQRLSAKVHSAVAQLRTYRDWFKSAGNRRKFTDATGLQCFTPRAIVVLGRSDSFKGDIDRTELNQTLPAWVTLRTYDDLVSSARKWLSHLRLSER